MEYKGIDVSKWQGAIDWKKVKESGVEFAIIRAGLGNTATQKDIFFERHYAGAKAAGLPVGAYWYSYATTTAEAVLEAKACLACLAGKQFEYPIWFDQEYEPAILALTNAQRTAIVRAFCRVLEQAGYYTGLYASTSFIRDKLNYKELSDLDMWAAQYGSRCTCPAKYGMWQYTSSGTVAGIGGRVDMDIAYKDYPAIIKGAGLNGYTKSTTGQPAGDGSNAEPTKEPEGGSTATGPAPSLVSLKIGPVSAGDKLAFESLAFKLGVTVEEM